MDESRPVGLADLHVHPSGDERGPSLAAEVYAALCRSDLTIAVLADHHRIDVARYLAARARDEGAGIRLVVGEEISTRDGHLVGIGLTTVIPRSLSLGESVAAIHDQGGLAIVVHPLLPSRVSASAGVLLELADGDPRHRPDALEALHPTAAWWPGWRTRVRRLAGRCGYAIVGGSDAHGPDAVGRARTGFPGTEVADLRAAIKGCRTWPEGRAASLPELIRRR